MTDRMKDKMMAAGVVCAPFVALFLMACIASAIR